VNHVFDELPAGPATRPAGHSTALVAPDRQRQLLALRIRAAGARLLTDLDRASDLVHDAAASARRTARRVALLGGAVLLGAAVAWLLSGRRQRIRITFR
jgi:hypothetical protein